jgi:hypothetical protein
MQTIPCRPADKRFNRRLAKLIAFRPQDESDIQDLLAAYQGRLDLDRVRAEFGTVADPADPRWEKFESWIRMLTASGE